MKSKRFQRMNDVELLQLLRRKQYTTCPIKGVVFNSRGRKLKPFKGKRGQHLFVVLFSEGKKRRGISLGRLIWMDAMDCVIPANWEIHHRDENPRNNRFDNLICLHPVDHAKLHKTEDEDDVPF